MSWLLANTFAAAVLALLVIAIGRWLRPAPAVMHGLWLVVMLKLITPPLFTIPLPQTWSQDAAPGTATATARDVDAPSPAPAADATLLPPLRDDAELTVHVLPAAPTAATGAVLPALQLAWFGSAALLLAFTAAAALRARRRHSRLGDVPAALRHEVAELASRMGVTTPVLCDDPATPAPYVCTIGRARLCVPARALLRCPPRGRAAVLAHELAHLRRLDHHVARAELLLQALLWWHPLFWFARARMRMWAELACDAIAVRTVPGASLDYATLLVDAVAAPATRGHNAVVLASRPSARADFERRLTMILNDPAPQKASRAWLLPFAGLTFGLFALPGAAQGQQQEPAPTRIEVRIDGKPVEGLTPRQRRALLELVESRRQQPNKPAQADEPQQPAESKRSGDAMPATELRAALREARAEIEADEDLRELGITSEVTQLLDDVADGKGIERSLPGLVRAAMRGAGKLVREELESDPDLQELGITRGISELVTGMLEDERHVERIGELTQTAMREALGEVQRELHADPDLRALGITDEVGRLVTTITEGGDFDLELQRVIERATAAAERAAAVELRAADHEREGEQGRIERRAVRERAAAERSAARAAEREARERAVVERAAAERDTQRAQELEQRERLEAARAAMQERRERGRAEQTHTALAEQLAEARAELERLRAQLQELEQAQGQPPRRRRK
ncbi:MAG: M56 family metallopeptidase [Planctomycetota bacterium]